jgi:hypothetical protein
MDQADFVHMVRMSEIASAENSSATAAAWRPLRRWATLGCWVVWCWRWAWWPGRCRAGGRFKLVFVLVLISGLTLLCTPAGAVLRSDAPDGVDGRGGACPV